MRFRQSNYYISTDGRVLSIQTNKILKPYRHNDYLTFDLHIDNEIVKTSVHRLLGECFIPNPNNYPLVRHLNDIRSDNRLVNLAWGTKSDNGYDAARNGKFDNRPSPPGKEPKIKLTEAQVEEIKVLYNKGIYYKDIATQFGIRDNYVYELASGRRRMKKRVIKSLNK